MVSRKTLQPRLSMKINKFSHPKDSFADDSAIFVFLTAADMSGALYTNTLLLH
jgi:hypothetical protein